MASHHSFDLSIFAAEELNNMVTPMIKNLGETEDRWDEVSKTAKTYGPDDPKDGSLLKSWYNITPYQGHC